MQMSLDMVSPEAVESLTQFSNTLLIASSNDFGGLAGPIAGLGFLAGLIVVLSPPLAD